MDDNKNVEIEDLNKNKITELLKNKTVKIALAVGAIAIIILISTLIVLNFVTNNEPGNGAQKRKQVSPPVKKADSKKPEKIDPKIDIKEELLTDNTLRFKSKDIFNPESLKNLLATTTSGYSQTSSYVATSAINATTTAATLSTGTPVITGVSPSEAQYASVITIFGKNFGSFGKVMFDDKEAMAINWSSYAVTARIPGRMKIGKTRVSVKVGGQKSNAAECLITAPPESISLTLNKILISGKKYAQIKIRKINVVKNEVIAIYDTKNYREGQFIGSRFKIININSSSIILLYGDERIILNKGETLRKIL